MKKSSGLFFLLSSLVLATLAGGCSKGDHDSDGVPNDHDVCPTVHQGRTPDPDPARRGCPMTRVPVPPTITPVPAPAPAPPPLPEGLSPTGDGDGDGTLNGADLCPSVPAGDNPDPDRLGCPATEASRRLCPGPADDCDGDGVLDAQDFCWLDPAPPGTGDPSRPGCRASFGMDAGIAADAGADSDTGPSFQADAGVSPTPPADDTGIAPHSPTTPADAAVSNDVPPQADPAETEADVPPTPPADAAVTQTDAGPNETQPLPVGQAIDGWAGRERANAFCWVTSDDIVSANAALPEAPCPRGAAGCWRRASAAAVLPLPAVGTRGTYACTDNSPLRWRCGLRLAGLIPCNAQTAATVWLEQNRR